MQKINDTIDMLEDIKAIEAGILQDSEYIKTYYCVDDEIQDKSRLTLISRLYVKNLSILNKFYQNNINQLKISELPVIM